MTDREQIQDLVHRYCDAVVHHDRELWASCWAEDSWWELGPGRFLTGRDAIVDHWQQSMKELGPGAAESMGITYQGLLDIFAQESAIKRLNEVEDVALVAVLLASDAGAGITGSLISIDGGTSPY